MKPKTILAALGAAVAASFAATAVPAQAAVSSASIAGGFATLNLDAADDNVTVSVSGGLLVHGQTSGGLNSGSDWDSATPGDQTVPANGTFGVVVNGGDGNDSLTVLAKSTEIDTAALDGGSGDDVLTGSDTGDSLQGGPGNDRLVGGKGDLQRRRRCRPAHRLRGRRRPRGPGRQRPDRGRERQRHHERRHR